MGNSPTVALPQNFKERLNVFKRNPNISLSKKERGVIILGEKNKAVNNGAKKTF